jgi:hypothetical protein
MVADAGPSRKVGPRRGADAGCGGPVWPVGYLHVFDVEGRLEAFLGCKVDLITPGGLRPELRQGLLADAVRAK